MLNHFIMRSNLTAASSGKMILFYFLLMLRVVRCSEVQIVQKETVGVGDNVMLTCTRRFSGSLFWIRIVSGDFPKILGKTYGFESDPRITATEEPGTFVLHIKYARLSDTAVYYCVKTYQQHITFLKGTDLRVEEPDPDITAAPPSDPVRPGASVTPQCSVLSDSENKTCPGEHSVCCFRAGSHQYRPSCNYTQGNGVGEHEKNSEGLSTKKCVYSFFKNVSSSDAGTYYCAVATCEEIFNGNSSKLEAEVWDSQKHNTILVLLCAALAISLIVIAFLIYSIKKLKKKSCNVYNAAVVQINAATASGLQQSQQTDEDSLVYSAPTFTGRKTSKGGIKGAKAEEEESIYTDVRTLGLD
ncbi:signal-regulatory protein beta-2-like isoform X2 [Sebastes umbrosus]|uniref:signal-regulatory protein beta-2-like isoform X2 n=1 Tax=Sebastes umbrosus TaxID=72105 RepID=UPI0018A05FE5|nr:signal-regulatory protein beta-2-like isoform X2 [Sebastes umbrosus]